MNNLDQNQLQKDLDITMSDLFLFNKNAYFYASLLSNLEFIWDDTIPTAVTNGIYLRFNPQWFLKIPRKTRMSILMHELQHVSNLHCITGLNLDPNDWNIACDIRINNDLENMGFTFEGCKPYIDQSLGDMPELDIYELVKQNKIKLPPGVFGEGTGNDIEPSNESDQADVINAVASAIQQCNIMGKAGDVPGNVELLLSKVLAPVVNWDVELRKFFTDLSSREYTLRRPNRRYPNIYLPSTMLKKDKLAHVMYFWDVSGSISDEDEIRFNSEVHYIKNQFKPDKLTLVQFDTQITYAKTFEKNDEFKDIKIKGRGGTDLRCVHNYIEKHKPTAVVIFSDLYVPPMQKLEHQCPILWVVVNNKAATVPFGKKIHIRT